MRKAIFLLVSLSITSSRHVDSAQQGNIEGDLLCRDNRSSVQNDLGGSAG